MKHNFQLMLILLSVSLFAHSVHGQNMLAGLDSVPMLKPKVTRSLYTFEENGPKEIQIIDNNIEFIRYKPNAFLRDAGNGALTAITGIGFSSTTDGNWKISGTVQCNDSASDWKINLFCEGYIEKNRERIKDDDGSWTVETTKTNVYFWEKNASGLIIEDEDTVGYFVIVMNPREDTLMKSWSDYILPEKEVNDIPKSKIVVSWKPAPGNDYGIVGRFRDKDFFIIRNGTDRVAWISIENILRCKFQSGMDNPGIAKKYRIMPYILINNSIPGQERRDLFRLALLSTFLNNYLS